MEDARSQGLLNDIEFNFPDSAAKLAGVSADDIVYAQQVYKHTVNGALGYDNHYSLGTYDDANLDDGALLTANLMPALVKFTQQLEARRVYHCLFTVTYSRGQGLESTTLMDAKEMTVASDLSLLAETIEDAFKALARRYHLYGYEYILTVHYRA